MAIVEPVASTPAGEPRRLRLRSVVDSQPIGEIEVQAEAEVRAAVERARKAQPEWAALSVESRAGYLRKVLKIVIERQEDVIETVIRETGKTRSEAITMEVFSACDSLAYYAKRASKLLAPQKRSLHGVMRFMKKMTIHQVPLGVVGVITPWNGPFILAVNPVAQALVAGNTVLLKPSEVTPFSAQLLAEFFEQAGLPEAVFQVLTGDGETGAALCEADIDKITFTGSAATGRKVAEVCGRRLVPCTLELGGKDPMIVCEDADIESAAAGALSGAYMNTGQYCCGTERVYVVDSVADEFIEEVVKRAGALRQGDTGESDVGAIFWPRQMEIIEAHMADAVAKGVTVRVGGRRNPDLKGLYYEPTVLTDVTHDMQIMVDETFGPILPIMRVKDEDEAIRLANDSHYGLGATIWTSDNQRAVRLAQKIESGSVCINDMTITYGCLEAPFGGRKSSGVGQINGDNGIRGYCHQMPVIVDRFKGKNSRSFYPFSVQKDDQIQKAVRFLFGTSLGKWIS
ncbi:MAG: aldehyde dehydrogenase family protein [Myxococcales bacterium]|nr:aldehyde dehydrogenase family protein [Myxococcales bacterium]MCH7866740.1 aldehyde dehydrogenase family protein [Myxococcales bacterium]